MKIWKVIVATALIFISGYSAGFFVGVRSNDSTGRATDSSTPPWERRGPSSRSSEPGGPPRVGPRESREDRFINGAIRGIREKVGVTDEEAEIIRQILVGHQKEMRERWAREISPIIDEEMAVVDQRILDALPTEEKRSAYRELMIERERRGSGGFRGGGRPNKPAGDPEDNHPGREPRGPEPSNPVRPGPRFQDSEAPDAV